MSVSAWSAVDARAERLEAHGRAAAALLPLLGKDDVLMVTADDEERFVRYYAKRLALMCEVALQMPVGVQATAVTYLKRFYLVHSVLEYHPKKILRTALFLACKTEERYYDSAQFAKMLQQGAGAAEEIVRLEPILLEALHFRLGVRHPFEPLHGFVIDARASGQFGPSDLGGTTLEQLHGSAKALVSRALQSDLVFEFAPSPIALACFMESTSGKSRAAFLSYLSAKFPVAADHLAMLTLLEAIGSGLRSLVDVSDETARTIDQHLQRAVAQRDAAAADSDRMDDDDDDEDDD